MNSLKDTSTSPDNLMFLFPLCTTLSRSLQPHGTVANIPGCGRIRKMYERLQRRIDQRVDKEPRSTSKQIEADLQAQDTTVSARTIHRYLNEKGRYGRRPRRTPLLTQKQKSRLEFAKTYLRNSKSF